MNRTMPVRAMPTSLSASKQERLDALRLERKRIMEIQISSPQRPRSAAGTPRRPSSAMRPEPDRAVEVESEHWKEQVGQLTSEVAKLQQNVAREKDRTFALMQEKQLLEEELQELKRSHFDYEQSEAELVALRFKVEEANWGTAQKAELTSQLAELTATNEELRVQLRSEKSQRLVLASKLEELSAARLGSHQAGRTTQANPPVPPHLSVPVHPTIHQASLPGQNDQFQKGGPVHLPSFVKQTSPVHQSTPLHRDVQNDSPSSVHQTSQKGNSVHPPSFVKQTSPVHESTPLHHDVKYNSVPSSAHPTSQKGSYAPPSNFVQQTSPIHQTNPLHRDVPPSKHTTPLHRDDLPYNQTTPLNRDALNQATPLHRDVPSPHQTTPLHRSLRGFPTIDTSPKDQAILTLPGVVPKRSEDSFGGPQYMNIATPESQRYANQQGDLEQRGSGTKAEPDLADIFGGGSKEDDKRSDDVWGSLSGSVSPNAWQPTYQPQSMHQVQPDAMHQVQPQAMHPVQSQAMHPVQSQAMHQVQPHAMHPVQPQAMHQVQQQAMHPVQPQAMHQVQPHAMHPVQAQGMHPVQPHPMHQVQPHYPTAAVPQVSSHHYPNSAAQQVTPPHPPYGSQNLHAQSTQPMYTPQQVHQGTPQSTYPVHPPYNAQPTQHQASSPSLHSGGSPLGQPAVMGAPHLRVPSAHPIIRPPGAASIKSPNNGSPIIAPVPHVHPAFKQPTQQPQQQYGQPPPQQYGQTSGQSYGNYPGNQFGQGAPAPQQYGQPSAVPQGPAQSPFGQQQQGPPQFARPQQSTGMYQPDSQFRY